MEGHAHRNALFWLGEMINLPLRKTLPVFQMQEIEINKMGKLANFKFHYSIINLNCWQIFKKGKEQVQF